MATNIFKELTDLDVQKLAQLIDDIQFDALGGFVIQTRQGASVYPRRASDIANFEFALTK
jgi:hypothetical protein